MSGVFFDPRLEQNVNMIRHHTGHVELVALPVPVEERVDNDGADVFSEGLLFSG